MSIKLTVIEEEKFNELINRIDSLLANVKQLADENLLLKSRYLTAKEVGQITGYGEKTIKNYKDEVGYITKGGELKFLLKDVDAWMMKDYVKPRVNRPR